MNDTLRVEFAEYEGPIVHEVSKHLCGFESPADLTRVYVMFWIERDPVEDYEMISAHPNVTILARGLDYYIEVSADGYRQIVSNPGLEEGHVLPFMRVE